MPISSTQVTVTTSPTLLVSGDGVAEGVYLHSSSGQCFIGGAEITTSNGYRMDNGDKLTINNHESPIYAVTSAGTVTMMVLVVTK
ncbi:MAG: hypothetical protein KGR70_13500 [Cyanobacteria bacterium REEB494]|nr:hypothetical protein [Cyanobacteria bacterium REEB494]